MLRIPYAINIAILVPVCLSLARERGRPRLATFQGKVENSEGLRWLLFSLWTAILLGSIAGLFEPVRLAPLLAVQIIYKAIWLLAFVLPLARTRGLTAVPWGITSSFIFIVLVWPYFFLTAWHTGT